MDMKLAYHKQYDFCHDHDKYQLFIKSHLLRLNPEFYTATAYKRIATISGLMYAIHLIDHDMANPNHEPVAECWINGECIYLWRNYCWGIAVDKNNQSIVKDGAALSRTNHGGIDWSAVHQLSYNMPIKASGIYDYDELSLPKSHNKTILLYQIGSMEIDYGNDDPDRSL